MSTGNPDPDDDLPSAETSPPDPAREVPRSKKPTLIPRDKTTSKVRPKEMSGAENAAPPEEENEQKELFHSFWF